MPIRQGTSHTVTPSPAAGWLCPDEGRDHTDLIYGAAWREHIEAHRQPLGFRDAKALAHAAFDAVGLPRPFVKRMPAHYTRALGYATPEWEIFVHEPTWDDTVLHEAAHLLDWQYVAGDPLEGHDLVWFSNYVGLLLDFSAVAGRHVRAFALDVARGIGPSLPEDFSFAYRVSLAERVAHWANLRPGDRDYQIAVSAGCRCFSAARGEPLPLRDPPLA